MERLGSQSSIKLVIKTPNQQVKDIEVDCRQEWTVEKLKSHLSTVYPTKPARSSQKIIYSGKLLHDHFVLKDVLQESEGNHQTIHLVCTPSTSEASSQQMTASASNSPTTSSSQVPSTPSSSTTMQDTTQTDGLRHRTHPFAQHPLYHTQFAAHIPHFPNVGQSNVHTGMAAHMYPPHYMYHNAQYYTAQQMAHMHWMQHMAQLMQANSHNIHGLPVQQNIPNPQQNVTQPVPPANQPAAAVPQAPQAQERRPNQGQNMVMNANAGGGMMQGDDDEDNGQRDWLDYVYMAVRISMLMSIFWFYSSAEKLFFLGLVLFIIWLVQSGMFNLNRAQRNRQEDIPVNDAGNNEGNNDAENNEGNNDAERQEPGDEHTTEDGEVIEGDSENESESQPEDEMDDTDTNTHPGYFAVWSNFFVTFFTSLVPQAPGAIAQP